MRWDWVNDSHYRVEDRKGIGITVIHEEPEDLLVETVCWSPAVRCTARPSDLGLRRRHRRNGEERHLAA